MPFEIFKSLRIGLFNEDVDERRLGQHSHCGIRNRPHLPSEDYHVEPFIFVQDDGYVHGIRYYGQMPERVEIPCYFHHRRTGIDDYSIPLLYQ